MKDLPEKKHPQVNPKHHKLSKAAADGMFFQKRAQPQKGHFFRDLPGRSNATFQKSAEDTDSDGTEGSATEGGDSQINSTPSASDEAGGGMYGTGKPNPKKSAEHSKLRQILDNAGPGETRSAVKVASAAPSDWEADMGIATGFHRPTKDQPEALEAGGERFHSTLAKPPASGSPPGMRHGINEGGSMNIPATSGHQLGKHAAPRFLGTGFAKNAVDWDKAKSYAGDRLNEMKDSLSSTGGDLADSADKAVKGVTKSPLGTTVAALVGAKLLGHAAGGVGRGIGRAFGRRPVPKPSMIGGAVGGLRKLISGK